MTSRQYRAVKLKCIVLEVLPGCTAGTTSFSLALPSERGSNGMDD